ncbi:MAG: hypothetical protein HKN16_06070 [Saprospiraceae bacterium]|nr:hypothetical protein [Saprospiraceae bacterium]
MFCFLSVDFIKTRMVAEEFYNWYSCQDALMDGCIFPKESMDTWLGNNPFAKMGVNVN